MATTLEKLRTQLHTKLHNCLSNVHVYVEEIKCPHCGNLNLVVDHQRGEVICPRCGTVVLDHLLDVVHPEYRVFDSEDAERLEHYYRIKSDLDLGTSPQYLDDKLRKIAERVVYTQEHRVRRDLEAYLSKFALSKRQLDELVELGMQIYKRYSKVYAAKIFSLKYFAAALAVVFLRKSIDEVMKTLGLERRRLLTKTVSRIRQLLPRQHSSENRLEEMLQKIVEIYEKLAEQRPALRDLEVRKTVMKIARELTQKMFETGLASGRQCRVIAASVLYTVLNLVNVKVTQREIANIAGCSDMAVRTTYRQLLEKLNIKIEV